MNTYLVNIAKLNLNIGPRGRHEFWGKLDWRDIKEPEARKRFQELRQQFPGPEWLLELEVHEPSVHRIINSTDPWWVF